MDLHALAALLRLSEVVKCLDGPFVTLLHKYLCVLFAFALSLSEMRLIPRDYRLLLCLRVKFRCQFSPVAGNGERCRFSSSPKISCFKDTKIWQLRVNGNGPQARSIKHVSC